MLRVLLSLILLTTTSLPALAGSVDFFHVNHPGPFRVNAVIQETNPPEEPAYDVIKQTVSINCAHGTAEVFITSKRTKLTQKWTHDLTYNYHYVLGQGQREQDIVSDLCAIPNPNPSPNSSGNQA